MYRAFGLDADERGVVRELLRRGVGVESAEIPDTLDIDSAVQHFWAERIAEEASSSASSSQEHDGEEQVKQGEGADSANKHKRDAHMEGFLPLFRRVAREAGLPASSVYDARGKTTVPGYFRATKDWDILVIHEGVLLAAIEIKSQIWSESTDFGKNVNNRCEEAIGNAVDLRKAYDKGLFIQNDAYQVAPFLGFLMVLEDCSESRVPKDAAEPHYFVRQPFVLAGTRDRYFTALQAFENEQLYDGVTLILTDRDTQGIQIVPPILRTEGFLDELKKRLRRGREQIEYVASGSA